MGRGEQAGLQPIELEEVTRFGFVSDDILPKVEYLLVIEVDDAERWEYELRDALRSGPRRWPSYLHKVEFPSDQIVELHIAALSEEEAEKLLEQMVSELQLLRPNRVLSVEDTRTEWKAYSFHLELPEDDRGWEFVNDLLKLEPLHMAWPGFISIEADPKLDNYVIATCRGYDPEQAMNSAHRALVALPTLGPVLEMHRIP